VWLSNKAVQPALRGGVLFAFSAALAHGMVSAVLVVILKKENCRAALLKFPSCHFFGGTHMPVLHQVELRLKNRICSTSMSGNSQAKVNLKLFYTRSDTDR